MAAIMQPTADAGVPRDQARGSAKSRGATPRRKDEIMKRKKLVPALLFLAFFIVLSGCASFGGAGHKYLMKGQILEVNNQETYLCIGSAEGAKAGQQFTVYRYIKAMGSVEKQSLPRYKREVVGTVKISEVVDEHFAKATILNGDIKTNDVAELNR